MIASPFPWSGPHEERSSQTQMEDGASAAHLTTSAIKSARKRRRKRRWRPCLASGCNGVPIVLAYGVVARGHDRVFGLSRSEFRPAGFPRR